MFSISVKWIAWCADSTKVHVKDKWIHIIISCFLLCHVNLVFLYNPLKRKNILTFAQPLKASQRVPAKIISNKIKMLQNYVFPLWMMIRLILNPWFFRVFTISRAIMVAKQVQWYLPYDLYHCSRRGIVLPYYTIVLNGFKFCMQKYKHPS